MDDDVLISRSGPKSTGACHNLPSAASQAATSAGLSPVGPGFLPCNRPRRSCLLTTRSPDSPGCSRALYHNNTLLPALQLPFSITLIASTVTTTIIIITTIIKTFATFLMQLPSLPLTMESTLVAIVTTAGNILPYHLFAYGALLGTELFQTFINTKLCYKHLPMREFIALQKRVFPVYFGTQVGLAALTASTVPPFGIISCFHDKWTAIPLTVVIATGALNWAVYGPRTTTASLVRRAVHDSAGKKKNDDGVDADDQAKIHRANRGFSFNHAMSIHINAISLVATIWYGFSLSSRLLSGL
ncbi:hypothetical protein N7532_007756 [Penicillium argentinense]|uniref:TMEM205-like domain-containing protein n=1 Tax=Penicillium argentinense TaxID=1131581 RepID=A0A9W9K1V8_9EURO|nr:uncharacterized protein N7532_007756 [Penicillium argentinense]KAJ5089072.1 hypothetical protein N7532_007756 [Penicillium argentinense]